MIKSTWKKRISRIVLKVAISYLVLVALVSILESRLVYPRRGAGGFKLSAGNKDLSLVSFQTDDDLALSGLLYNPKETDGVILFCHGNGEWIGRHEHWIVMLGKSTNMSVLSFDYRGYGDSEGSPHEAGLIRDGQAAYDYLVDSGFPAEKILVYGRSLGGGVACAIAEKNRIGGLFLQNTFSSMVDVGASRFFWLPVRLIMRNRFPSVDRIKNYTGPLLQCHGTQDRVVPFRFGKKLFEHAGSASEDKAFVTDEGGGHNDSMSNDTVERLQKLLARIKAS